MKAQLAGTLGALFILPWLVAPLPPQPTAAARSEVALPRHEATYPATGGGDAQPLPPLADDEDPEPPLEDDVQQTEPPARGCVAPRTACGWLVCPGGRCAQVLEGKPFAANAHVARPPTNATNAPTPALTSVTSAPTSTTNAPTSAPTSVPRVPMLAFIAR